MFDISNKMGEQDKNKNHLGGARISTKVDDELTYPLTRDEYHIIQDNCNNDNFTNFESILLSLGVTSIISFVIFYFTDNFYNKIENIPVINWNKIIILMVYGGVGMGTLLGFAISRRLKKKSKSSYERLENKILKKIESNE